MSSGQVFVANLDDHFKNDYLIEQVVLSKSLIKVNLNWKPAAADLRMLDSFFLFILFRSNSSGGLAKIFESFVLDILNISERTKGNSAD